MAGFFTHDDARAKSSTIPLLPQCGLCGLYKGCISPKMPVTGQGKRKVLICGEAPGEFEDQRNEQFVGDSGKLLQQFLRRIGVNMREDCWITNSIICHPPRNELPPKAIDYCRPNLIDTIEQLKPSVVLLLGGSAVSSVIRWIWKADASDSIGLWAGWQIPSQKLNCWICPTYHPSYIMRLQNARNSGAAEVLFEKHLRKAFELKERPWNTIVDYKSQVMPFVDDKLAAEAVEDITKNSRVAAFDYETDSKKPSGMGQIVSCSISNGKETIAFPWHGRVVEAVQKFLLSDVLKIASNIAFEELWTENEFCHGVKNWHWDVMECAHALDSRPGITSIKFQSFVLLGHGDYDSHIKPYLEKDDSYAKNRIRELDLNELLIYNGLDSLFEYKVAEIQMKQLGVSYG